MIAESVLHKTQAAVLQEMKARQLPVTLSIGAITYGKVQKESPRLIVKEVDNLVYQVKRAGKNSIIHINL